MDACEHNKKTQMIGSKAEDGDSVVKRTDLSAGARTRVKLAAPTQTVRA